MSKSFGELFFLHLEKFHTFVATDSLNRIRGRRGMEIRMNYMEDSLKNRFALGIGGILKRRIDETMVANKVVEIE